VLFVSPSEQAQSFCSGLVRPTEVSQVFRLVIEVSVATDGSSRITRAGDLFTLGPIRPTKEIFMRLPVHRQRDVARLHFYDPEASSRALASSVDLAPNTVEFLRKKLRAVDLTWQELEQLDDDEWQDKLETKDKSIAKGKEVPNFVWVHEQMRAPDATQELVWQEWRKDVPDGIGYTSFTTAYKAWRTHQHITMRQAHLPGYKGFVDFAGRTVEIVDINGGPSTFAKIFVAVLGYSNYTFVKAVPSEKKEDFVQCHVDWFEEIEGVPHWVIPDNLKSAIVKRERDFIYVNPAYKSCLQHYGTATFPTGVRKPKHKAKAEVGVQIAQRYIIFPLRHRKFFSIDELNVALKKRSAMLNEKPFKKMAGSRMTRFVEVEKSALKQLPVKRYEYADWRYDVRVKNDHHVELLGCYYSVPYHLVGQTVNVKFSATLVELFAKGRLLTVHDRLQERGQFSTNDEHRPLAHRIVLDGEPKALLEWAASVGTNTLKMFEHHLTSREDVTNGLKAARNMRSIAISHSESRLEEVCTYALERNITTMKSIRSILISGADKRTKPANVFSLSAAREAHRFVRGSSYYTNDQT
jgi:transposase